MTKPASFAIKLALSGNLAAVFGAYSLISMSSAVLTPAHAERWTEDVTIELTYLGDDLKKREKEYSERMNLAIHEIVSKHYEKMQDNAFKALDIAQKEWGPDHLNTMMAIATAQLAKSNAIMFFGGGTRAESSKLIMEARIFAIAYPEFPGSYYINILADISKARLIMTTGTEAEAAEYYDKALAAMKQSPGISNIHRVQSERDYLMVP